MPDPFDLRHPFDDAAHLRACASSGPATRTAIRDDDLMDAEDISRMTGMTIRWVYETFSIETKGGIRPMKLGNKSRWYSWEVKAWIAARRREADSR